MTNWQTGLVNEKSKSRVSGSRRKQSGDGQLPALYDFRGRVTDNLIPFARRGAQGQVPAYETTSAGKSVFLGTESGLN